MSQLQNRFPEKVMEFWIGWYKCLYPTINEETQTIHFCNKNHADVVHHIISPTAYFCYVSGKHNTSIFNSTKVNNDSCHLYKPMQNKARVKAFLNKTKEIVMQKVKNREYALDNNDYQFLKIYEKSY